MCCPLIDKGIVIVEDSRPDWYPMSPPELPADAPVAFLAEPVKVAFGVAFGRNFDAAACHSVHRSLREARRFASVRQGYAVRVAHPHKPLIAQIRLNRRLAPI